MFYAAVPVDPGKTLSSVTLPDGASTGQLHVFSIGTSTSPLSPPVATSVTPGVASGGQQVTIDGSGFGASQGSGYVEFSDNGSSWGGTGQAALTIDSWSDSAVTFTVPSSVSPGSPASVTVVTGSGSMSDSPALEITPTSNPSDYYDDTGTSPDNNQSCANYDGVGYSYSANALAAAGFTPGATVKADGLTLHLDGWAAMRAGQHPGGWADDAASAARPGPTPSACSSPRATEAHRERSRSTTRTAPRPRPRSPRATGPEARAQRRPRRRRMPYRNSTSGSSQQLTVYVYATTVPVDPNKTVESITFPNVSNTTSGGATAMHIWAVTLGTT